MSAADSLVFLPTAETEPSGAPALAAERTRVAGVQARIARIGGGSTPAREQPPLPLGIASIDAVLPGGGLPRGCLHEILPADGSTAAAAFAAVLLARLAGHVRHVRRSWTADAGRDAVTDRARHDGGAGYDRFAGSDSRSRNHGIAGHERGHERGHEGRQDRVGGHCEHDGVAALDVQDVRRDAPGGQVTRQGGQGEARNGHAGGGQARNGHAGGGQHGGAGDAGQEEHCRLASRRENGGVIAGGVIAGSVIAGSVIAGSVIAGDLVLWCRSGRGRHDPAPYGPGLAGFGVDLGRLLVVRGRSETEVLWAMEEGLRSGVAAAVLGEATAPSPIALRRLQLAAEAGGGTALLLRPYAGAAITASATTRWRVGSTASAEAITPARVRAGGQEMRTMRSGSASTRPAIPDRVPAEEAPDGWRSRTSPASPSSSGRAPVAIRSREEAAVLRWKEDAAASVSGGIRIREAGLPVAGLSGTGVPAVRWRIELLRCRAAAPAEWLVDWCDATHRLIVAAPLRDRSVAAAADRAGGADRRSVG
jgi:hypothetical protein